MEGLPERLHSLISEDSTCIDRLTDCFRNLRNLCVIDPEAQGELGRQEPIMRDTIAAIKLGLEEPTSDEWTICLRVGAQFFANLTVNNSENQQMLWARCRMLLKEMACRGDTKLTDICLMVVYNIMIGCPDLRVFEDDDFLPIIFESGADGCEFATYIAEHIISKDLDWSKIYNEDIPVKGRLFVLDMLEVQLKESPKSVSEGLILQMATQFCKQSDCILRTVADRVDALEPIEVATLLRLLASCLSDEKRYDSLRDNKSFLINCAFNENMAEEESFPGCSSDDVYKTMLRKSRIKAFEKNQKLLIEKKLRDKNNRKVKDFIKNKLMNGMLIRQGDKNHDDDDKLVIKKEIRKNSLTLKNKLPVISKIRHQDNGLGGCKKRTVLKIKGTHLMTVKENIKDCKEGEAMTKNPSKLTKRPCVTTCKKKKQCSTKAKSYEKEKKRKQREKIKANPEAYAKMKESEKNRSKRRREEGKLKRIDAMSKKEQRLQRKKWVESNKRRKERNLVKKMQLNLCGITNLPKYANRPTPHQTCEREKVRRGRFKY